METGNANNGRTLTKLAHECEALKGADLTRYTDVELAERLKVLLLAYRPLGVSRNVGQLWFRGVKCNSADGYDNLKALHLP